MVTVEKNTIVTSLHYATDDQIAKIKANPAKMKALEKDLNFEHFLVANEDGTAASKVRMVATENTNFEDFIHELRELHKSVLAAVEKWPINELKPVKKDPYMERTSEMVRDLHRKIVAPNVAVFTLIYNNDDGFCSMMGNIPPSLAIEIMKAGDEADETE